MAFPQHNSFKMANSTRLLFSSTASSGLNSLTAVALEDIVKRKYPNISDQRAITVSKFIGEFFSSLFQRFRLSGNQSNRLVIFDSRTFFLAVSIARLTINVKNCCLRLLF